MVKILFLNNEGAGFADFLEVEKGTTVNQLFNALKPVVLPGEVMNVKILKEGKEPGQGVAYLDDGTMVVVDNARRYMGKTVDVTVTSVLQTTAGRMIFTILKEDAPENFYSSPNH